MTRIVPMVAIIAALAVVSGCSELPRKAESVTVAVAAFESAGLVYVAEDQSMFAKNGLRVTYRSYDTGVDALNAVMKGEADIAVGTAEYPLVATAFSGGSVSAIACIDRPDFIYLVGRKDRGIEKPSDLAGKRIGTVSGSIAQFYLGRFLELNNVRADQITSVDLRTPQEWRAAIADGDVDAVTLAQPEASLVKNRLGDNATFLSVQGGQSAYTLAIARNEWIEKNPSSVKQFLAALADAEGFVAGKPSETRTIIQKQLGLDSDYMDVVETQNKFALSLDQSLITAMEDEARWMIKNQITSKKEVPDFSDYVYTDGLKQVKPETVNIVR